MKNLQLHAPKTNDTPPNRTKIVWLALVTALLAWGLTDVRRRARIDPTNPGVHKSDLTVFTGAGAEFFIDRDPYTYENPRGWKYPYLPFFALAMAPLAFFDSQTQAVIWFVVNLAMCWGCVVETKRLIKLAGWNLKHDPVVRRISLLAIVAVAFPALNCLQRGQVGILLVYLLLLGVRLLLDAPSAFRMFAGAFCITASALLKLLPLLPLGCLLLVWAIQCVRGDRKGAATGGLAFPTSVFASGVLLVFVLPGILVGSANNLRHIQTFSAKVLSMASKVDPQGQVETPYTLKNQSFTNATYRLGNLISYFAGNADDRSVDTLPPPRDPNLAMDQPAARIAVSVSKFTMLAALLAVTVRLSVSSCSRTEVYTTVLGLSSAACLILSPISRGHYFVLLIPSIVFVGLAVRRRWGDRAAIQIAAVPACLCIIHYLFVHVGAGRAGVLGIGTAMWFVASCVLTLRSTQAIASSATQSPEATAPPSRLAA